MISAKEYEVTKRIKLHTKPIRVAQITQVGRFVKETQRHYIFSDFRVRKDNVISIKERM